MESSARESWPIVKRSPCRSRRCNSSIATPCWPIAANRRTLAGASSSIVRTPVRVRADCHPRRRPPRGHPRPWHLHDHPRVVYGTTLRSSVKTTRGAPATSGAFAAALILAVPPRVPAQRSPGRAPGARLPSGHHGEGRCGTPHPPPPLVVDTGFKDEGHHGPRPRTQPLNDRATRAHRDLDPSGRTVRRGGGGRRGKLRGRASSDRIHGRGGRRRPSRRRAARHQDSGSYGHPHPGTPPHPSTSRPLRPHTRMPLRRGPGRPGSPPVPASPPRTATTVQVTARPRGVRQFVRAIQLSAAALARCRCTRSSGSPGPRMRTWWRCSRSDNRSCGSGVSAPSSAVR